MAIELNTRRSRTRFAITVSTMGLVSFFAPAGLSIYASDIPAQQAVPASTPPTATQTPSQAPSPTATASAAAPAPATTPVASSSAPSTPSVAPSPTRIISAAVAQLDSLSVKGRAPKTGYDRAAFSWRSDTDRNGCDTRNDVLRRDLANVGLKANTNGCVVVSGQLQDPYSGQTMAFATNSVDIDHVVALSDAWQKGAGNWSQDQRTAFANDPLNLIAVPASLNRQKSDGDAATWLPPAKSYRCEYVTRQMAIKAKYGLWVTQAEKQAVTTVLSSCPTQAAFAAAVAWPAPGQGRGVHTVAAPTAPSKPSATPQPSAKPKPTAKPRPTQQPTQNPEANSDSSISFKNCTEVKKAGRAPIHRGEPGYAPKLDRDNDGIACEK